MVRKAVPQTWYNRAEGLIHRGAALSIRNPEEQAAGKSQYAGIGLW